jgi:hypothetical protein
MSNVRDPTIQPEEMELNAQAWNRLWHLILQRIQESENHSESKSLPEPES